tara:strand:+ start:11727 stop:12047 length:321 start_codon:yes stop_codon:yes gene_type:complete
MTRIIKPSEVQGDIIYSWKNEDTGESVTVFESAEEETPCEARERLIAYLNLVKEISDRIEREGVQREEERKETLRDVESELGIMEEKKETDNSFIRSSHSAQGKLF